MIKIMANTISGKMKVSNSTSPDWSVIPSKGMARRSDSEIIEDIKKLASERFSLSGAYVTFPVLTIGGFGTNVYSQGKNVLSHLGDGWTYEMTPEEWNKGQEFYSIYNSALKTV